MSGETAQCTVDTTVINLIPVSATVVLMPVSPQVSVMADRQRFEDGHPREKGDVHGPAIVVRDQMIFTGLQAIVALQKETDIPAHLTAIREAVGLLIGIPSGSAKDLDTTTANDRVIDRALKNTAGLAVGATVNHTRIKTVEISQQGIKGHL